MLYEPSKTKKYILIGAAAIALIVLALVFWGAWKMKPKPVAVPTNLQKTNEDVPERVIENLSTLQEQPESQSEQKVPETPPEEVMKNINTSDAAGGAVPKDVLNSLKAK